MRMHIHFTAALVGLAMVSLGSTALAQFEVPPGSLKLEESGTLEGVHASGLQFRDSKMELWLLNVTDESKVTVQGDAEPDCLRPGSYVQLTAELDKKGNLKGEIGEIEIITVSSKAALGVFVEGADGSLKTVRVPTAGEYQIKGRLASNRDGELVIMAGSRKFVGTVSDDLKVKLSLDDVSVAQQGDAVKVLAWYNDRTRPNPVLMRPGQALAEKVTITLAKPLAHSGKKLRGADRPVKTSGKK